MMRCAIWYNLHNIKNTRVKHPWRNVTFRKLYTPWVLFTFFFNSRNGTKSRKASQLFMISFMASFANPAFSTLRLFINISLHIPGKSKVLRRCYRGAFHCKYAK